MWGRKSLEGHGLSGGNWGLLNTKYGQHVDGGPRVRAVRLYNVSRLNDSPTKGRWRGSRLSPSLQGIAPWQTSHDLPTMRRVKLSPHPFRVKAASPQSPLQPSPSPTAGSDGRAGTGRARGGPAWGSTLLLPGPDPIQPDPTLPPRPLRPSD